jgi:hypothetical protein
MNQHAYTYSPAGESQLIKRRMRTDAVLAVLTIAVFAGIGVMLAWRG